MILTTGLPLLKKFQILIAHQIYPRIPYILQRYYSCIKKKKRALTILAPGVEEIEFVTPIDTLRRGGVDVIIAGLEGTNAVQGTNGICLKADIDLCDIYGPFDAVILPGGPGETKALCTSRKVGKILEEQEAKARIIAAICAAPMALKVHEIGYGKRLTSYPSVAREIIASGHYKYMCEDVVVDDYLITSQGPATALKFALTILMHLTGEIPTCDVAKDLLVIK